MTLFQVDFGVDHGIKKIPSGEKLNYHGGALRGDHFVERMLVDHFEDILNAGQKEIDK